MCFFLCFFWGGTTTGFLADLAVAGWPGDPEGLPLLAIWPEDPSDPGMVLPSICNASAPEHKLFGDLTGGVRGVSHRWIGPNTEPGRTMPTVIGYHTTGPGMEPHHHCNCVLVIDDSWRGVVARPPFHKGVLMQHHQRLLRIVGTSSQER